MMACPIMNALTIVRKAIPEATTEVAEFIVWNRTTYPFEGLTARDIYKAADRWHRAHRNQKKLCTFCDRLAMPGRSQICERCRNALTQPMCQP